MGLSDVSTPIYQNINEESSLMTSDMSQVMEISERNDSSYSMLGEKFEEDDNIETSTHDKPPGSSFGERTRQSSGLIHHNQNTTSDSMDNNNLHTAKKNAHRIIMTTNRNRDKYS